MPRIVVSGVPTTASRHITVLDGMRALAIIGVIGYHTRPSLLPGGFLGVTLFFVVSGFLLTRSMVNLFERLRFSYPHFLRGRVRRLWPSVLATIAGTAILVYCMAPSLLPKVRGDALPSALFYSNWSFIFRKLSYFQAAPAFTADAPVVHKPHHAVLCAVAVAVRTDLPTVPFARRARRCHRCARIGVVA